MKQRHEIEPPPVPGTSPTRRAFLLSMSAAALLTFVQSNRLSALAQDASPVAPAVPQGPIKLVILYNTPDDPMAFDDYYLNQHLPKARLIPNYQRLELARIVATADGSPSPFHRVTEMVFPDMGTFQTSLASAEAQAALADTVNFAAAGALTLITEIDVLEDISPIATPSA